MNRFAELLDRLSYMPARNGKLRLLANFFAEAPDPARGYALAALTGELKFASAKPASVRALAASRVDAELFALSYDFVGDLAETVALIWSPRHGSNRSPGLEEVVETLMLAERKRVPELLETWLDVLDANGRWALLKLVTGGLRVGVSARLAKSALAQWGDVDPAEIEEIWHGLAPPYGQLFAWLQGKAEKPVIDRTATFRPLMLAHPLDESDLEKLDPGDFRCEWKWDGIRVQLVAAGGRARLFSRSGDEISAAFPDIVERLDIDAVLDGELLVLEGGEVAPFNNLQQRLNRKRVTQRLLKSYPAHLRLYDMLFEGERDYRTLPFDERRQALEAWYRRTNPPRMDISPLIVFNSWRSLAERRQAAREEGIEGLMLKRADSPYLAGRPKGFWFKWKRDPLLVDAVLMYAQRGHGKRSSFYSDYTFGLWRTAQSGDELVPIGKAYFGFSDAELKRLDKWVRDNTLERFGPVRAVKNGLVLEIAFDAVQESKRHKSGLALRFPRIHRIRWDKPASEADRLAYLAGLLP